MPDMFSWGMRWLSGQMLSQASETVTYARGADTVDISTVVGAAEQSTRRDFRIAIDTEHTEFLIDRADLVIPNVGLTLPERGDQIVRTIDGKPITYLVTQGPDQSFWRVSSQYEDMIRIYTNRKTD